ncbi:phosphate acyltransferase PlsX [Thermosipho ferrireducens]|uniref:Phosphate acyltransferase n=1 Tax=Thermosipho ferrireducens TaxID=2571116 RepID=A0ABX7S9A1_9BACT|nr:phosphate acyltransferase PlsX [Thermosipho ferrireducens]QTA38267.1 phosphate acyltransferase PlsX [Thermosipho ferrireducens]
MIKLAVDVMGGDKAPAEILAGAVTFARNNKDTKLILVGIDEAFKDIEIPENCSVVRTEDYLPMDVKPTEALRRKKSTMYTSCRLVKDKEADGVVSAGNTGALLSCATFVVGRIKGIERPTLAVPIPTEKGFSILADAGANIDVKSSVIAQFGIMAVEYAKVMGIENPTVGLLNVGTEQNKGTQREKGAFTLLENIFKEQFLGNIEGNDINKGVVDVIVSDGFAGNVAMKTMEGVAKLISNMIKSEAKKNILGAIGALLMYKTFRNLKKKIDPRMYGGTFFIGVNGVVVKAHGNSDRIAIYNALKVAKNGVKNRLPEKIKEALENVRNSRDSGD